jgi:hypothetical protein
LRLTKVLSTHNAGGFSVEEVFCFRRSPGRLLYRSGIVGALAACSLSFLPSARAQTSPCDLNGDGVTNALDVTLAINMALGTSPCTAKVEGLNICTVITVQRVFDAYNGQPCVVYNAHAANLSWTASGTPNVTYNIYRATTSPVPLTTPYASTSGTTFKDTNANVTPGATYYYAVTASANGVQSTAATAGPATIPSP